MSVALVADNVERAFQAASCPTAAELADLDEETAIRAQNCGQGFVSAFSELADGGSEVGVITNLPAGNTSGIALNVVRQGLSDGITDAVTTMSGDDTTADAPFPEDVQAVVDGVSNDNPADDAPSEDEPVEDEPVADTPSEDTPETPATSPFIGTWSISAEFLGSPPEDIICPTRGNGSFTVSDNGDPTCADTPCIIEGLMDLRFSEGINDNAALSGTVNADGSFSIQANNGVDIGRASGTLDTEDTFTAVFNTDDGCSGVADFTFQG